MFSILRQHEYGSEYDEPDLKSNDDELGAIDIENAEANITSMRVRFRDSISHIDYYSVYLTRHHKLKAICSPSQVGSIDEVKVFVIFDHLRLVLKISGKFSENFKSAV